MQAQENIQRKEQELAHLLGKLRGALPPPAPAPAPLPAPQANRRSGDLVKNWLKKSFKSGQAASTIAA
jgi:hypothetical protein